MGLPDRAVRGVLRAALRRASASIRRCVPWRRTATRSRRLCSNDWKTNGDWGWVDYARRAAVVAPARASARRCCASRSASSTGAASARWRSASTSQNPTGATRLYERVGHARVLGGGRLQQAARWLTCRSGPATASRRGCDRRALQRAQPRRSTASGDVDERRRGRLVRAVRSSACSSPSATAARRLRRRQARRRRRAVPGRRARASRARGRGVADALLDAAERWAADARAAGAVLRAFAAERDAEVQRALERRGYRLIRHSFRWRSTLPDDPEPPVWPEGVSVRTFDPERDEQAVYAVPAGDLRRSLGLPPDPDRAVARVLDRRVRASTPTLWWLAEERRRARRHFASTPGTSPASPAFGWIGMLGVRRPVASSRARARAAAPLVRRLPRPRRDAGSASAWTPRTPTGAVRLYERAGMRAVRRERHFERTL